jgi:hypothetical protein
MDFEEIIKTWCTSRDLKQNELIRKSHSFSANQLEIKNSELEQFYKVMELNHWFEKESRLSQFLIEKLFDENIGLIKELDEKKQEIQQLKDKSNSIKCESVEKQTKAQTETGRNTSSGNQVESKSFKKLNEKIEAFKKRLSKERQRSRHLSKQTRRLSRCLQAYVCNLKPKRQALIRKEKLVSLDENHQIKGDPHQYEEKEEERQRSQAELSPKPLGIDLSMEELKLNESGAIHLESKSAQNSLAESQSFIGNSSLYDDDAHTNLSEFLFQIEIVKHDTTCKFIRIENKMNNLIDVGDWQLVSYLTKTSSAHNDGELVSEKHELFTYKFHFASSIRAKSQMTLWSADAEAAKHRPPSDFIMFKVSKSSLQECIWSFDKSKRGAKQFLTDVLYDSNGNVKYFSLFYLFPSYENVYIH